MSNLIMNLYRDNNNEYKLSFVKHDENVQEFVIDKKSREKGEYGCRIRRTSKNENGLTIEKGIYPSPRLSTRIEIEKDGEIHQQDIKIIISEGYCTARIIGDSDYRQLNSNSDIRDFNFDIDNKWVSFHIERETEGIGANAAEISYIVMNQQDLMQ